jgi:pimeloyl-ACP methyl ester carboxylesterase
VCVGANYYNDDMVKEANKFADVAKIERDQPTLAAELASYHDRNKQSGYWRTLIGQLAKNLAVNPAYSIEDLRTIPVPTLLMSGENDLWANPKQMLEMRQNIPNSEMLIVNNAGHEIQYTHPHIVGPVIMDFLERYQNFNYKSHNQVVKQVTVSASQNSDRH